MNKKYLAIGITALVLGIFVFASVGNVFAQEATPETEVVEETPLPVVNRRAMGKAFGRSAAQGQFDADGDGVPDQLRLEDGTALGSQFGYGYGPGDGTCDGECDADGDGIPDQSRLRDGSGTGGQYGPGDGTCDGECEYQGAEGQFGPGAVNGGMGGRGMSQGQGGGLRDGSCAGN